MNGSTREARRQELCDSGFPTASMGDDEFHWGVEGESSSTGRGAEERRLVARCMLGEQEAWATLFRLYHPLLVDHLESATRFWGGDREQAEEVAAVVWCSLYVGPEKALRRYNPDAGSLLRFLKYEARCVFGKWLRTEKRGRMRECKVARREAFREDLSYGLVVEEFLATLTCRERELCLAILLNVSETGEARPISRTNESVVRCRIMKKLRSYMIQNN